MVVRHVPSEVRTCGVFLCLTAISSRHLCGNDRKLNLRILRRDEADMLRLSWTERRRDWQGRHSFPSLEAIEHHFFQPTKGGTCMLGWVGRISHVKTQIQETNTQKWWRNLHKSHPIYMRVGKHQHALGRKMNAGNAASIRCCICFRRCQLLQFDQKGKHTAHLCSGQRTAPKAGKGGDSLLGVQLPVGTDKTRERWTGGWTAVLFFEGSTVLDCRDACRQRGELWKQC